MNLAQSFRSVASRAASWITQKAGLHPFYRPGLTHGMGQTGDLRQPYAESAWVHRAIKNTSGPITAVPLKFYGDRKGGDRQIEDPDMIAFWQRPARTREGLMSQSDFTECLVGWLQLAGEAFIVLDDTWLNPRDASARSPLMIVRPDRIQPIQDRRGQGRGAGDFLGWEYRDADQQTHLLLPSQVRHPKFWNPYHDLRGLAPWAAAKIAAQSDYAAGVFAKNLMENNGDRGPFVIAKGGVPSDAQRQQIEDQLRQKQDLNRRGIYKTAFITGDIAIEDPKIQVPDADFVAQRVKNRHEIFIAFGVPASMADLTVAYSIGSASDRFRLIEDTCKPIAAKLEDHIEEIESMRRGISRDAAFAAAEPIYAAFDWTEHSVFQEIRREDVKAIDSLWTKGMPMRAVNDFLRLGMKSFPGWDTGYLPFNLQPVNSAGEITPPEHQPQDGDEPGPPEEDEDPNEFEQLARLLQAPCPVHSKAIAAAAADPDPIPERDPARVARWRAIITARIPAIARTRSAIRKVINDARVETLRNITAAGASGHIGLTSPVSPVSPPGPTLRAGAASDLVFDLSTFLANLVAAVRVHGRQSINDAAADLLAEIDSSDPFIEPSIDVLRVLANRSNHIKDASADIHQQILMTLAEGLEGGETMNDLSERVRVEFNGITKHRAETIAHTETNIAYSVGRDMAIRQTGVQWKEWLTAGDDRVRASHFVADGQQRRLEAPFDVGLAQLMFPSDPNGPPDEIINCRCVHGAIPNPV